MKGWNFFGFLSTSSSPLHKAAQELNCNALLNELNSLYLNDDLREKINSFYQDKQQRITPLCAVLNNRAEKENILTSIRYLLSFGADPSLNKKFLSGKISNAPIHEAARKGNFEAIAMLVLSGASIYQKGIDGILIHTLLQRAGHDKKKFSFLTHLESLKNKFEERKKNIQSAKIAPLDRTVETIIAYEKLIADWEACKEENFLNQLDKESENCFVTFIEDKIILLKHELYEFINEQLQHSIILPKELTDKLQNLLSNILEYEKIHQLPIPREQLAANYASLIIKLENQSSKKENNYYSPLAEGNFLTFSLRKRNVDAEQIRSYAETKSY